MTDYTFWLQGLVDKCELIIITARPGEMNQPTEEALAFLKKEVIDAGKKTLEAGVVTEAQYAAYMALYQQFQLMERTGIAQSLSEGYYYYIRNLFWDGPYAAYDSSTNNVVPVKGTPDGDRFMWRIEKRPGGTVYLYNKATETSACPVAQNGDQAITLGEEYAWTLEERTLDGKTGICIIDASGSVAWYTNPNTWKYVLMKDFWGACAWEFVKTNVQTDINTPIYGSTLNGAAEGVFYDLQGRKVEYPAEHGVYICGDTKVAL